MIADHLYDIHHSRLPDALKQAVFRVEAVHAFQIESQADETPFTGGGGQAAQRELAKPEDFFDDANDRLNRAFSQSIDSVSDLGLEFVGHLEDGAGLICGWFGLLLEKGMPIEMMGFASSGDIGLNAKLLATLDVGFTEVSIIQGDCVWLPKLRGDRLQGGQGFLFIVGMIREGMGHDQHTLLIGSHLHIVVLVKASIGAVLHDARVGIGEVVLILVAGTRLRGLGRASFRFVMTLAGFLGAFFQFGFILRFFSGVAFVQRLALLECACLGRGKCVS